MPTRKLKRLLLIHSLLYLFTVAVLAIVSNLPRLIALHGLYIISGAFVVAAPLDLLLELLILNTWLIRRRYGKGEKTP